MHLSKDEKNKWDLMMSGPASLAVISFIKNWHKKLRLLVDLRIFSKFQGLTPTKMRRSKFPANMHNTIWRSIYIPSFMINGSVVSEELKWQGHYKYFLSSKGHNSQKMTGSKFLADMHNTIWWPIYIPSFMKIGLVVSEELRWQGHLWVFSKFQGA